MYTFLLVLLILDAILLAAVILLQAGQGGGLASLGGGTTDLVVGGRQAATLLTKASWILGGSFLFLALMLSVFAAHRGASTSEVQQLLRQTPAPTQQAPLPLDSGGAQNQPSPTPANPAPTGN